MVQKALFEAFVLTKIYQNGGSGLESTYVTNLVGNAKQILAIQDIHNISSRELVMED
jgi:hypothetical protein